jgi:plasmid stabilization system protein ParE
MATLRYTRNFQTDLDRLTNFLLDSHPEDADGLIELILDALGILQDHPEIGRPHRLPQRELVISRGKSGYLALYKFNPVQNTVILQRIRHQRESGYRSF